jgi:hypothetical protein
LSKSQKEGSIRIAESSGIDNKVKIVWSKGHLLGTAESHVDGCRRLSHVLAVGDLDILHALSASSELKWTSHSMIEKSRGTGKA